MGRAGPRPWISLEAALEWPAVAQTVNGKAITALSLNPPSVCSLSFMTIGLDGSRGNKKSSMLRQPECRIPESGTALRVHRVGKGYSVQRPETIRGLERGLQVLLFLQSKPISSLHGLHVATRISKPS